MIVALAAALALLASGPADLQALRHDSEVSSGEAARARQDADTILAQRDKAGTELDTLKKAVGSGQGGFFGDRKVAKKSAEVRALVDQAAAADALAKRKESAADEARAKLRDALFLAASADTSAADDASRAGRREEALRLDREAAALLGEASKLEPAGAVGDPWRDYPEIPVSGAESAADRAAIAAAYRASADEIHTRVAALEVPLASAQSAVAAWERLSRFQGILDRYPAADPTPRRDRLAAQVQKGRELEATFRRLAEALTAQAGDGGKP